MSTTTRTAGGLTRAGHRLIVLNWLSQGRPKREYSDVYNGIRIGLYMREARPFEDLRPSEAKHFNELIDVALQKATMELVAALVDAVDTFAREHPDFPINPDHLRDPRAPALSVVDGGAPAVPA